jgi:hypothetical protein
LSYVYIWYTFLVFIKKFGIHNVHKMYTFKTNKLDNHLKTTWKHSIGYNNIYLFDTATSGASKYPTNSASKTK